MATNPGQLAGAAAGLSELRSRLVFVLMALLVYRTGTHIPVPGINPERLAALFDQQQGGILDLFNMFSGGALERMSILALGVVPYITSSIIMNLMSMMYPSLQQLRKEGESGRRKITQYTRYGTLLIALIQGTSLSVTLANQGLAFSPGFAFLFVATTTLVTGALFMMWLGEQITERGVGNGISLIIFSGIVSGFPAAIGQSFEAARQGDINIIALLAIAMLAIAIIGFVVFVERGQRRITVNYAKRQQGRRVYQGQSSHLPLLRLEPAARSCIHGSVVRQLTGHGLAAADFPGAIARTTAVHTYVRRWDHLFQFLLYRDHVRSQGRGGQSEAAGSIRSGDQTRSADRQVHR
jgi:preprotein translocase subunit SecY